MRKQGNEKVFSCPVEEKRLSVTVLHHFIINLCQMQLTAAALILLPLLSCSHICNYTLCVPFWRHFLCWVLISGFIPNYTLQEHLVNFFLYVDIDGKCC